MKKILVNMVKTLKNEYMPKIEAFRDANPDQNTNPWVVQLKGLIRGVERDGEFPCPWEHPVKVEE